MIFGLHEMPSFNYKSNFMDLVFLAEWQNRMISFQILELSQVIPGYIQLYLVISGYIRLSFYLGLFRTIFDYLWLYPAILGCIGLSGLSLDYHLTIPGLYLEYFKDVSELSHHIPRIIIWLPSDFLWVIVTPILSLDYPWIILRLLLDYPWSIPEITLDYH